MADSLAPPGDSSDAPRIASTFAKFQELLGFAEAQLDAGRLLHAAVVAQIAAHHASYNHPGAFFSPRLERLVRLIGARLAPAPLPPRPAPERVGHVLHLLTAAKDVGGDSRFVWRWIGRDRSRRHSVALTQQMKHAIPRELREAVAATGGSIHVLDAHRANVLKRARDLRALARHVDMVALHIYPEDIVPMLAFGDPSGMPPVVFVAQADHQFWVGLGASDLVAHLRGSGAALAIARRDWTDDRTALLPIPLDDAAACGAKAEARARLGIPADSRVLLTVARAIKYEPIREPDFAHALLPVLNRHPDTLLLAVGPQPTGRWERASQAVGGRIRAFGQRSDTADFYAAADVYVDSFPFASNTSLLEAGLHGLPLVTFNPFAEADVLGAGTPGMDPVLICTDSLERLQDELSRLLDDPGLRARLGAQTRACILDIHQGAGWGQCLDRLYEKVVETGKRMGEGGGEDVSQARELDSLLHRFYSGSAPLGWIIGWYVRHMPYFSRCMLLRRLMAVDHSFSFNLFLPVWLGWVGAMMSGWRRWAVFRRFARGPG